MCWQAWARDAMGRAYNHLTDEEAAMGQPDRFREDDTARLRRLLVLAKEAKRLYGNKPLPNDWARREFLAAREAP